MTREIKLTITARGSVNINTIPFPLWSSDRETRPLNTQMIAFIMPSIIKIALTIRANIFPFKLDNKINKSEAIRLRSEISTLKVWCSTIKL